MVTPAGSAHVTATVGIVGPSPPFCSPPPLSADEGPVRHWWWRAYLVGSLAVLGAYAVAPGGGLGRAWLFVGLNAAALAAIVLGLWVNRPERPLAWVALATGEGLLVWGDVLWYLHPALTGSAVPFPSLADAVFLAGYTVVAAGLALLLRRQGKGRDRVGLLDDEVLGRLDTDGSELAAGVDATATTLSVAVTAGPFV